MRIVIPLDDPDLWNQTIEIDYDMCSAGVESVAKRLAEKNLVTRQLQDKTGRHPLRSLPTKEQPASKSLIKQHSTGSGCHYDERKSSGSLHPHHAQPGTSNPHHKVNLQSGDEPNIWKI